MSQIINIQINLAKIDKKHIKEVTKNGVTYKNLDVTIFTKDEPDQYGHTASMSIAQTKDQRDAKEPTIYLGNGKVVFSADSVAKNNSNSTSDTDSLPF
jgi:hypothetical protein